MGRKFLAISGVWFLAFAVLAAADFWEEKAFTDWSDKDVEKMMSNSPWAKRVTVVFRGPPREGGGATIAGGNAGGFGRGGRGGSDGQSRLVIQWRSSLPVRQALVRERIGEGGTVEPEAQALLNQRVPGYYVVITGLPGQFGRLAPEELMAEARLERKGKPPIVPTQANPQRDGRGLALLYVFPLDEAIVLEDKDVEFATKLGDTTIKKKFKLEDMVFNDQLEL